MNASPKPAIPVRLVNRPVSSGLVVPWITALDTNGRALFGIIDSDRQRACLYLQLCQVCGDPLSVPPIVLLMRLSDLARNTTPEPALHPECAAYTVEACPMVNGQMSHYRRTTPPLPPSHGYISTPGERQGQPAEPWFAVWTNEYEVGHDPSTGQAYATWGKDTIGRIRPVGRPPWLP